MKKDFYLKLESVETAQDLLESIRKTIGEIWDTPTKNSFNDSAVISWNLEYLRDCQSLINGLKSFTFDEAMHAGYPLGYHKGRFSQASQKLEEAQFILDAIENLENYPNFPAYRALFYSLQSQIYATRESLKKACRKSGGSATEWWNMHEKKIKKNELLIQRLHIDYNIDKHGHSTGILVPNFKLFEYKGPPPDIISGEGAFSTINKNTARERRIFHGGAIGELSPYLQVDNQTINGVDASNMPLVEQLKLIIEFFEDLLFEAKIKFPT